MKELDISKGFALFANGDVLLRFRQTDNFFTVYETPSINEVMAAQGPALEYRNAIVTANSGPIEGLPERTDTVVNDFAEYLSNNWRVNSLDRFEDFVSTAREILASLDRIFDDVNQSVRAIRPGYDLGGKYAIKAAQTLAKQ